MIIALAPSPYLTSSKDYLYFEAVEALPGLWDESSYYGKGLRFFLWSLPKDFNKPGCNFIKIVVEAYKEPHE